jgi:hypothetical protein
MRFKSFLQKGAAFKRAMKKGQLCPGQAAAMRQAFDSRKRIKAELCAPGCALEKRKSHKPPASRPVDQNLKHTG